MYFVNKPAPALHQRTKKIPIVKVPEFSFVWAIYILSLNPLAAEEQKHPVEAGLQLLRVPQQPASRQPRDELGRLDLACVP